MKIYENDDDDDEYDKRVTAAYDNNGDQAIMTFAVYFGLGRAVPVEPLGCKKVRMEHARSFFGVIDVR